jgi:hypothetical protein
MKFIPPLLTLCTLLLAFSPAHAAVLFSNPITGTTPNSSNPFTTGQIVDMNITVSGIGRGAGITGTDTNDRYNATSWNSASPDSTAYFTWILTPNPGYQINFTSFVYTSQASGTGPTAFAFQSSRDGFVTAIGTPTATGATLNLSGVAYQNVATPIEFRLYGWNATSAGGTFSINDFTFNGIAFAIPEPSRLLLLGLGSLSLIFRRRRA